MEAERLLSELYLRFRASTPELWGLHSRAMARRGRRLMIEVDGETLVTLNAKAIAEEIRRRAARESGAEAAGRPDGAAQRLW